MTNKYKTEGQKRTKGGGNKQKQQLRHKGQQTQIQKADTRIHTQIDNTIKTKTEKGGNKNKTRRKKTTTNKGSNQGQKQTMDKKRGTRTTTT